MSTALENSSPLQVHPGGSAGHTGLLFPRPPPSIPPPGRTSHAARHLHGTKGAQAHVLLHDAASLYASYAPRSNPPPPSRCCSPSLVSAITWLKSRRGTLGSSTTGVSGTWAFFLPQPNMMKMTTTTTTTVRRRRLCGLCMCSSREGHEYPVGLAVLPCDDDHDDECIG